MTIEPPEPVADYVAANARLDIAGMIRPFSPDAVVIDAGIGKRFEGHGALRTLFEEEVFPVKAIFTPHSAREEDGKLVVEGPALGDFPGSPLRFTYNDGAIRALEITL